MRAAARLAVKCCFARKLVYNLPHSSPTSRARAFSTGTRPARRLETHEVMSSYFYIDPQGREQGPFSYEHVAKWFKAGYLKPNLGCRRNDETTYGRTVTQALLEDGVMNGVPSHMLGEIVKPTTSPTASSAGGGGSPRHVSVPPPPAGAVPQRSADEIAQCMDRLFEVLDHILPIVLEGGLREEFGPVWEDMLHTPPPWTLETTLKELRANWSALFSNQPRRMKEIEILLDAAIRQRKNQPLAPDGMAKEISTAAVALLSACPKTFPPAVIEHLRVSWEECEKIRAYVHM